MHKNDLTVSRQPGTKYLIEIHFAVGNHLFIYFFVRERTES